MKNQNAIHGLFVDGFYDVAQKAEIAALIRSFHPDAEIRLGHNGTEFAVPNGMVAASEIEAEWTRWQRLRVAPDRVIYGAQYSRPYESERAGTTWLSLIEEAALDMGLAHPDQLHHVHVVFGYGGESDDVAHGKINWKECTVDFDPVHRYGFDQPAFRDYYPNQKNGIPARIALDTDHQ